MLGRYLISMRFQVSKIWKGLNVRAATYKYLLYYPATLSKGERVGKYLNRYKAFQYYDRHAIRQYQLTALKQLVKYAYHNSTLYRTRFNEKGLTPDSIAVSYTHLRAHET